jgi:hypothetical protein
VASPNKAKPTFTDFQLVDIDISNATTYNQVGELWLSNGLRNRDMALGTDADTILPPCLVIVNGVQVCSKYKLIIWIWNTTISISVIVMPNKYLLK